MIYLFDNKEELIAAIAKNEIVENLQVWIANGLINASCSFKYQKNYKNAVYFGAKDIDDESIFWLYKIDNSILENKIISLEGTHVFFDDLKGYGFIKDIRPKNKEAGDAANQILDGTRWSLGVNTATRLNSANYYYENRLTAWWDFITKWGVEFKPRMTFSGGKIVDRRIDIADKFYFDYGKIYSYGDNLISVIAESNNTNIKTAYVGMGRGSYKDGKRKITFEDIEWSTANGDPVNKPLGQEYVELPSATAMYGYSDGEPRIGIVDINTDNKEVLLQKTYEHLLANARPLVQFKTSVVDTSTTSPFETVGVVRNDIGIRYKTRVLSLKRDFLNPKVREIEFGDKIVTSYSERQAKVIKRVEEVKNSADDLNKVLINSIYNDKAYNYQLEDGNEYGLPSGYYSFDKPINENPTKVIFIGAGKLAIANDKNPDGSWNFRTFINGDRVLADTLQTQNVMIDGSGVTVNNGALTINDAYGKTLITSQGLKALYQTQSSGPYSGYQLVGYFNDGMNSTPRTAQMRVEVPEGFVIESARMTMVIGPAIRNGTQTFYPKQLKLTKVSGGYQFLDYPTVGEYYVLTDGATVEDLSNELMGGQWNPSDPNSQMVEETVDIKNHLMPGTNQFELESASNQTAENIGVVRFYTTLIGYLKGGVDG